MAKVLVLALSAPLLLIGAAYPPDKPGGHAVGHDDREDMVEGPVTYRPCRPGPGDDNCIQLYERGVRTAYASWLRDHEGDGPERQVAMGGPVEPTPVHRPRARNHDGADQCGDRHPHHDEGPSHHDDHGAYGDEARGM
jgi:hypothetical protein